MALNQQRYDRPAEVETNVQSIKGLLQKSDADPRPVALMLCGISGAGKSTYSKAFVERLPSFHRFSIDGIIAERHGIYGVDYARSEYEAFQEEADALFGQSVERTLSEGRQDLILDRSFYAKEDRDFYKQLIENHGGRWVLLHLKVPRDVLWSRICARREAEVNADSAREISRELLDMFFDGFETPVGEGEVVIESSS